MRTILSIAGPFLGGIVGYYAFSKAVSEVEDNWAYFNEKESLCMVLRQHW